MADTERLTDADRDKRRGYNEAKAKEIANSPRIKAKNARAAKRQKLKDQFIADHPELVNQQGVFIGEDQWQAVAPKVERAKD